MNKDNLIEFAEEQCEIFPEDSYMGEYLRETLKMLQAGPCEDAISRSSVFEIMGNLMSIPYDLDRPINKKDVSESMNEIRALPSVKSTQGWIPVTEDAPPKGTICLWCNKQGSVFTSEITYRSECNSYVGKHGYSSNGLKNHGDIVAWMPLPKPYKTETESEE